MLRFAEEITLLLLDDEGRFQRVPSWSLNYALAGGVLMDLALEYRNRHRLGEARPSLTPRLWATTCWTPC